MKTPSYVILSSWLLAAAAILGGLFLHLVPAALAALLVFVLVSRLSGRFFTRLGDHHARVFVTAFLALVVGSVIVGGLVFLGGQLQISSMQGLTGLWIRVAAIVSSARDVLPPWVVEHLPSSAEDIQALVVQTLKEHTGQLQNLGKDFGLGLVHVLIGSIIGGMVAVGAVAQNGQPKPLRAALLRRASLFSQSFERVVLGQGRIAIINASLTGLYLAVILPIVGFHLPFLKTIIVLTLVMGFIPVLGNLVSNFVIVVVSASVGFGAAVASLVFLVVLHKLEYFLAAKILGKKIHAKAWEMLCAMLVMEAAFGVAGVITAPIIYAYIKAELVEQELI